MRIGRLVIKRRVLVGLAFGLTAIAVWWSAWTRSKQQAAAAVTEMRPSFVRLAGTGEGSADQVLREQAEYFDPTPLFFPTEWNFGQSELPDSVRRQPGQVFGSFEAKLTIPEQNLLPYGGDVAAAPDQITDVLSQGNQTPFSGMGQSDFPRSPLVERSGFLEIRAMKNGDVIAAQMLVGAPVPQADFGPLEFIAAVSSAGLVSDPVLVTGSGREEVDAFFRTYLVKSFRLGERLSPGLYRVLVGP